MKKLNLLNNTVKPVLILDKITSDEVEYCIPKSIKYDVISTRNCFNLLIQLFFLPYFFYYYYYSRNFFLSNTLAICRLKKTKVVLTFTDNDSLPGQIKKFLPSIMVISIQNGLRSINKFHNWQNINFDILYGFGNYEQRLIKKLNLKINEYNAVGSLRYGIFKENNQTENKYFKNRIVYISTWRMDFSTERKEIDEINKNLNSFLPDVNNFCVNYNKKFSIITASKANSKNLKWEIEFFNKKNKNNNFLSRSSKNESYTFCQNSEIIISHDSTLAFEMYGAGKKVLFLGSINNITEKQNWGDIFAELPDLVKIVNYDKETLFNKLNTLNNMSYEKYLLATQNSRNFYMNNSNLYVHQIIKKRVSKFLE